MLAEAVASTALPKVIKSFTNTYEFKLTDNFDNSYFVLSKLNASVLHCTLNCAVVVLHLELILLLPKRKRKACLCYVVLELILRHQPSLCDCVDISQRLFYLCQSFCSFQIIAKKETTR